MDKTTNLLDIRNSRYARELLDDMRQKAESMSYGDAIMLCSYWKDKVENSATETENNLAIQLETKVKYKLGKCRGAKINIVGYVIVLAIYITGIAMMCQSQSLLSRWSKIITVFSIICTIVYFIASIFIERLWTHAYTGTYLYHIRIAIHLLFTISTIFSVDLPLSVKTCMIRTAALVNVMNDSRLLGTTMLVIVSDGLIMAVGASHADADRWTTGQTVVCICCFMASSCHVVLFFLWRRSSFDDLAGLVLMVLDKLILNVKTYTALGGEPTFWQKTQNKLSKSKTQIIGEEKWKKQISLPEDKILHSVSSDSIIENLIAQQSPTSQNELNSQKSDSRVSVSADQIEDILQNVFYTSKTKQNFYSEQGISNKSFEDCFSAACNNLKQKLNLDLSRHPRLSMTQVWEDMVDKILSKFNCLVELVNLDFRSQGSPNTSLKCTMRIFSIWSTSEKCRIIYSKLEKKEHTLKIYPTDYSKRVCPDLKHDSTLPYEDHSKDNISNSSSSKLTEKDTLKQKETNAASKEAQNKEELSVGSPSNPSEKDTLILGSTKPESKEVKRSELEHSNSNIKDQPSLLNDSPQSPEVLISVVVHEMRTPLMCVLGNLELIDYEIKNTEGYELLQPLIKSSTASCVLLENLVSDILDAARISKGIFKIEPSKFNLEQMIRDCLSIMAIAANARQIKLHLYYEASHKLINSDMHRLKQVLLNLISNSIKFTQNGDIWIRVVETIGTIKIVVKDNGSGIDENLIPQLFEKFQSDRKSRANSKGIGLGLFICRSIIGHLGPKTTIDVISKSGEGSEFTVELFKNIHEKVDTKNLTTMTTWKNRQKFVEGSYGLRAMSYDDLDKLGVCNKIKSPKSAFSIFALNNQSSLASRRLIQTKMKWDISWVTKHLDKLDEKSSDEEIAGRSGLDNMRKDLKQIATKQNPTANPDPNLHPSDQFNPNPQTSSVKSTPEENSEHLSLKQLRVLIVDDEPMILELIKDFFDVAGKDLDIDVIEDSACSVEQARLKMADNLYDLVVLDFYLQDGTGPEFVHEYIANRKDNDDMPLFALSTGTDIEDIQKEVDLGIFFRILLKPISLLKFKELLLDTSNRRQT